jgi:hypothetical protein
MFVFRPIRKRIAVPQESKMGQIRPLSAGSAHDRNTFNSGLLDCGL